MPCVQGTVEVFGKIAYVSQTAWIQSGTIRDNILFGSSMDEHRYQETLDKCSLVKDLELLPYGDLTEIGERGVNLSGGQKQRMQLARALYQDADIYLLDDPFSAVDAHTASSLFNEYVMEALSGKTVLLITHQVDFLPAFDSVLLMSDGEILRAGHYHELLSSCPEFVDLVNAHKETAGGAERLAEVATPDQRRNDPAEKIASEGLKHRVFETILADLQNDEDQHFRKIRLRAEDVQGRNVLTQFWGMDLTTDKLRSLVRKWQTLIEAHVDVKTTDNYTLRMFCIGFTKRRPNQVKRTTYAQSSQIRQIRRKMREIMVNQASSSDLKDLVAKFIPESIGKEIEKATSAIYPLQNVYIRKVKILKSPKFDLGKLMEVHGDYTEDIGVKVDRSADEPMAEGEAAPEIVGA